MPDFVPRRKVAPLQSPKETPRILQADRMKKSPCLVTHRQPGGDDRVLDLLSYHELEVIELIVQGYGAGEMARLHNLSVKAVGVHKGHIKRQLAIEGATELPKSTVK
jgi:DNA-binding CsgD family transcriptional regulator